MIRHACQDRLLDDSNFVHNQTKLRGGRVRMEVIRSTLRSPPLRLFSLLIQRHLSCHHPLSSDLRVVHFLASILLLDNDPPNSRSWAPNVVGHGRVLAGSTVVQQSSDFCISRSSGSRSVPHPSVFHGSRSWSLSTADLDVAAMRAWMSMDATPRPLVVNEAAPLEMNVVGFGFSPHLSSEGVGSLQF